MSTWGAGYWEGAKTASTPHKAHACNCIGCCQFCGSCRTWWGHTPAYCALLVRQAAERFKLAAEQTKYQPH